MNGFSLTQASEEISSLFASTLAVELAFPVLHEVFGRFKDQQTLGKGGFWPVSCRGQLRSVVAVVCSIVLEVPNFALGGEAVGLYSDKWQGDAG
jgi:hypothetical protein